MPSQTLTQSRLSVRDLCVVAAVYILSFLFLAGFPHPLLGFPLDDSWIHQVVARNLAHDGTLGFIPGVRSSGSSSLLWSFLLAANWKFLPAMNPVIYSRLLNGFLLIATGWGLLAMARKDSLPETSCWIWALTPALSGNFMWLGAVGMEHVLFVALSVAGVYLWFQESLRSSVACAICLGALSLTRPEGMVLAVLVVLGSRWARRERRDILIVVSAVVLCVLISLTANIVTSHSWLPTTYAGRKWLYFGAEKIPLLTRIMFPYTLARNILRPWEIRQTHFLSLYFVSAIVLIFTAIGVWDLFRTRRIRTSFLCIWSFVHIGIYTVMLPSRSHGGRYQPLFLALSFPLMYLGVEVAVRHISQFFSAPRLRHLFQVVAMLLCVFGGLCSLKVWREVTRDGIIVIEMSHAKMGELLVHTLPPESRVAALDIGRIGYIYGGRLVDLGGLTDNSLLPYMREHRLMDYLAERDIPYFVWPSNRDDVSGVPQILDLTPEVRQKIAKLASFCAPEDAADISYDATTSAAPCQTLYQLNDQR
jgi:hypothetical protein